MMISSQTAAFLSFIDRFDVVGLLLWVDILINYRRRGQAAAQSLPPCRTPFLSPLPRPLRAEEGQATGMAGHPFPLTAAPVA